jgi:alpha-N-arabinofuranosidase
MLAENDQPTFVGIRQESAKFSFDTKISLFDIGENEEAGICVYQINEGYVQCCLGNSRSGHRVGLKACLKGLQVDLAEKSLSGVEELWLRVNSDSKNYNFFYSTDGERFKPLQSVPCSLMSTETVGGFTGVVLGLYAYQGSTKFQMGRPFADFDYVDYTEE